jgi:ATP-dependent DNA ligase
MDLATARRLSADLEKLKGTGGSLAKQELTKGWTSPAHAIFLDLVGNNKRQWRCTWAGVQEAPPRERGIDLMEVLMAAEAGLATPAITAGRIRGLLADGWPENVLKAIVEKTLDAGLTVASVKKAQGKIQEFQPALCADWLKMSQAKREKLLSEGQYYATPKMDGLRALFKLHTPDRGVYSRNLKPLYNMDSILEALESMIDVPCHVDGEAFATSGTWNESMTGAKRKGAAVAMRLHPFDVVLREEVDARSYKMPAKERWELLRAIQYDDRLLVEVPRVRVRRPDEAQTAMVGHLEEGWEGTVLHDALAPYSCKRSTAWIKMKQFISSEFEVTGFIAGTGKHHGRLGALAVQGVVDGVAISSEVGTGFSDAEREAIWAAPQTYLGAAAEIRYFEVTPPNKSGRGSLRFPIFVRFREEE